MWDLLVHAICGIMAVIWQLGGRLDWIVLLCDDAWRRAFPEATLTHLSHSYSDHTPILLRTLGQPSARLGLRPFKFQAACMMHSDFDRLVHDSWIVG